MTTSTEKRANVVLMDSPYLKLLAVVLLFFSLYLLSQQYMTGSQIKTTARLQVTPLAEAPEERLVRVFSLPEKKKEQAAPQKESDSQSENSKTITRGHTPAIDASFSMPVQEYLRILKLRAGANLILFDNQQNQIKGEIIGERFIAGAVNLKDKSLRARNISHDLSASFRTKIIMQTETLSKPYKFLIVLPKKSEQVFEQVLADQLSSIGIIWSEINRINLRYEESAEHINARIQSVDVKGKITQINKTVEIW